MNTLRTGLATAFEWIALAAAWLSEKLRPVEPEDGGPPPTIPK